MLTFLSEPVCSLLVSGNKAGSGFNDLPLCDANHVDDVLFDGCSRGIDVLSGVLLHGIHGTIRGHKGVSGNTLLGQIGCEITSFDSTFDEGSQVLEGGGYNDFRQIIVRGAFSDAIIVYFLRKCVVDGHLCLTNGAHFVVIRAKKLLYF